MTGAGPASQATSPTPAPRLVIVLAGPTGAGKTTWADRHDLDVISWESAGRRDWEFWQAVQDIGADARARCVIERSAPERELRLDLARVARADRIYVLAPVLDEVVVRIIHRNRTALWHEIDAAARWYDLYEPDPSHGPPPEKLPW